jgi:ribosome-associated toxin RatA of RatAB toxin-antitoxin module
MSDYNNLITKFIEQDIEGYEVSDKINSNTFHRLQDFINFASDNANREYELDFEIFNRDIYLSISHNPKDILNMSISKFYSSCQHLYSGSHNSQLLGNFLIQIVYLHFVV